MYHRPRHKLINRPLNNTTTRTIYGNHINNTVIAEAVFPIKAKHNVTTLGNKLPEGTNLGISAARLSNNTNPSCVILPSPEQYSTERHNHQNLLTSNQNNGILTIRNLTKQLQFRSEKLAANVNQQNYDNDLDDIQESPQVNDIDVERLNLDRRGLKVIPELVERHPNLKLLNLQHNTISNIENLSMLKRLIFIDLYDNDIAEIVNFDTIKSLRVLMLGKNRIKEIKNLNNLSKLDVLDLHGNHISTIGNLNHLTELRVLNLAGNRIDKVCNIAGLCLLQELNLRKNVITKVDEVDLLPKLQRLFIDHNQIVSFSHASSVLKCASLIDLTLEDNPMIQSSKYRAGLLIYLQNLKILDGKKISAEERRTSAIMARKAEEKQQERHKAAIIKEKKRLAILNAQKEWQMKMRLEFGHSENVLDYHSQIDFESNDYNSDMCSNSNGFNRTADVAGCMVDSYLIDIEDDVLYLFGTGALEGCHRLHIPASTHTISFKYISFDDIIHYLSKLKSRMQNIKVLEFSNNNLRILSQLNALTILDELHHLIIRPEGNSLTTFQLWKYYVLFRLANLKLHKINHQQIDTEDIIKAKKLFGSMLHVTTPYLLDIRTLALQGSCEPAIMSLLKYHEPNSHHIDVDGRIQMRSAVKMVLRNYTDDASKINQKLTIMNRFWPTLMSDIVEEAIDNNEDINNYMQNCLETFENSL